MKPKEVCYHLKTSHFSSGLLFPSVSNTANLYLSPNNSQSNTAGVSPSFPHLVASVFYFSLPLGLLFQGGIHIHFKTSNSSSEQFALTETIPKE